MRSGWPLWLVEEALSPGSEPAWEVEGWRFCLVQQGVVYWLGQEHPVEATTGELLVVWPQARGGVRVSQVQPAEVRRFHVAFERVTGVFGMTERVALARAAAAPTPRVAVLPRDHAAAKVIAGVRLPVSVAQRAVSRAELLHGAVLAVAGWLAGPVLRAPRGPGVRARVRELVMQAPDGELLEHSAEELADRCGCSARYLTSLFRSFARAGFRPARDEMRLRRARELIEQTRLPVAEVAREAGYPELPSFLAAFIRLFGCTPEQCRSAGPGGESRPVLAAVAAASPQSEAGPSTRRSRRNGPRGGAGGMSRKRNPAVMGGTQP